MSSEAADSRVLAAEQSVQDAEDLFSQRTRARLAAETTGVEAHRTAVAAEAKFLADGAEAWPALKAARDAVEMHRALLLQADRAEATAKAMLSDAQTRAADLRETVRLERIAQQNRELADATVPLLQHLARHVKTAREHHELSNGASSVDSFLRAIGDHLWAACDAEQIPQLVLRKVSNEVVLPTLFG